MYTNENFVADFLDSIVESEYEYNDMMRQIGLYELRYMEENGTEIVYSLDEASEIGGKIKAWFAGIVEKIKKLIDRFILWLQELFTKMDKMSKFINEVKDKKINSKITVSNYITVDFGKMTDPKEFMDSAIGVMSSIDKDEVNAQRDEIESLKDMCNFESFISETKEVKVNDVLKGAIKFIEENDIKKEKRDLDEYLRRIKSQSKVFDRADNVDAAIRGNMRAAMTLCNRYISGWISTKQKYMSQCKHVVFTAIRATRGYIKIKESSLFGGIELL